MDPIAPLSHPKKVGEPRWGWAHKTHITFPGWSVSTLTHGRHPPGPGFRDQWPIRKSFLMRLGSILDNVSLDPPAPVRLRGPWACSSRRDKITLKMVSVCQPFFAVSRPSPGMIPWWLWPELNCKKGKYLFSSTIKPPSVFYDGDLFYKHEHQIWGCSCLA